jgi:hypothetical protein
MKSNILSVSCGGVFLLLTFTILRTVCCFKLISSEVDTNKSTDDLITTKEGFMLYRSSKNCFVAKVDNISSNNTADIINIIHNTFFADNINSSDYDVTTEKPIDLIIWQHLHDDLNAKRHEVDNLCSIVDRFFNLTWRQHSKSEKVRIKRAMVTRCYHMPYNKKICRFVRLNNLPKRRLLYF